MKTFVVLLFAILTSTHCLAGDFGFEELAKLFQQGKFKKCVKLSDQEIEKDSTQALPFVYKALSLYQGRSDKKVLKLYPDPQNTAVGCMKEAKKRSSLNNAVPATFWPSIKEIQNFMFRDVKKSLKNSGLHVAKKTLSKYLELFDNSSNTFTNFYFESGCKSLRKTSKKHWENKAFEKANESFALVFYFMQSEFNTLDTIESNKYRDYRLVMVQQQLFNSIQQQFELGYEKSNEVFNFYMEQFDNRDAAHANVFLTDLFHLFSSKEKFTSMKEQLTSPSQKHMANLKVDIKAIIGEEYYSEEWNNPKYLLANTFQHVDYLSEHEKRILFISNLARLDPILFRETFLVKYLELNPEEKGRYSSSLKGDLAKAKNLGVFIPGRALYDAATYHAKDMGNNAKTGHVSTDGRNMTKRLRDHKVVRGYIGENCDYGVENPAEIVLHLLVDNGVSSLGHRENHLNPKYRFVGISYQPHGEYGVNTVFDFSD